MNDSPQRYLPDRAFPPYAFLPGSNPHPTRDPEGHSFSEVEGPESTHLPASEWRENADYLFGCDLYNAGYLWEAHEAWEDIWHPSKHDQVQAEYLQGLIQCAAASLKIPMEQPRGLVKLAENGTQRLEGVLRSAGSTYMGLDLSQFIEKFRSFASSSPSSADERPRLRLEP